MGKGKKNRSFLFITILSFTFIILLFPFSGYTGHWAGVEGDRSLNNYGKQLDQKVPELMKTFDIAGSSITLIKDGEVVWSGAYGYADKENVIPVTTKTLFRAESITKSMTAWAVMSLVEEGKINLNDPIEAHLTRWKLPKTEYDEEKVTVKQLLSHSSGVTGSWEREPAGIDRPPIEEVLSGRHGLDEAKLIREPGSKFEYSNQGFLLLELLVEEVAGTDFETYIQERILEPLEMENTTYQLYEFEEKTGKSLAKSYYLDGEPVPLYLDDFKAPGGLFSTSEDLARFFAAGMDIPGEEAAGRGILEPDSVEKLYTSVIAPVDFYALGSDGKALSHFIENLPTGEKAVFHGGEGAGSLSNAYIIPEKGEGIVILTNSKGSYPFLYEVLGEFAELAGVGQPAMSSLYSKIETGSWIGIFVIAAVSIIKACFLMQGLGANRLEFAPFSNVSQTLRLIQTGFSVLLLGAWWIAGEVFIRNLLPVIHTRLGIALVLLAVVMLVSSTFIKKNSTRNPRKNLG